MVIALSVDPVIQPDPTVRGLYQAALDSPDDDTPRLLLADWLEEHGDTRGEFIRLQCARSHEKPTSPQYQQMLLREAALLRQHRHEWIEADRPNFGEKGQDNSARFVRGLPEFARIEGRVNTRLNHIQQMIDQIPLNESYLEELEYTLLTATWRKGFGPITLASPHCAQLFIDAGLTVATHPDAWANHVVEWLCWQGAHASDRRNTPGVLPPLIDFLAHQGLDMNRVANIRTDYYWDLAEMKQSPTIPLTLFDAILPAGATPAKPDLVDTRDRLHEPAWRAGWEDLMRAMVRNGATFGIPEQQRLLFFDGYQFSPNLMNELLALAQSTPQPVVTNIQEIPAQHPGVSP